MSVLATTVLVVDDDEFSQMLLSSILTSAGYRVLVASDAFEAFDAIDQNRPSLVITDWVMPGMDGIEFCRAVRDRYPTDPIYILMLTGHSDPAQLQVAIQAGANQCLSKPVRSAELLDHLNVALHTPSAELHPA